MKLKVLFLLALTFVVNQVISAQVTTDESRSYQIGPGDKVAVKVIGEPEYSFEGYVDENGRIQAAFTNDGIVAKCRTETELRTEVAKYLSKYLRNPQLSVNVTERKSRRPATVYGEVKTPQQIELTRKATLRELLAFSGGPTKEASGMIQITRTQPLMCAEDSDQDWKTISDKGLGFPSKVYSLGSLSSANPEIYPGDIIDVRKALPVYVVGEVLKPGELIIPEGGLPLTQAVAMASGITREARTKTIKIHRRKEGTNQPEVITVNFDSIKKGEQKDVMLEPFDIVEVDKTKKNIGDIFYDFLINAPNRIPLPIRPF